MGDLKCILQRENNRVETTDILQAKRTDKDPEGELGHVVLGGKL